MKHPFTAFLLTFVPGVGHMYLTRHVRGFVYLILTLVPVSGGILLSMLSNDGGFFFVGGIFALLIYGISFVDMIAMLVSGTYKSTHIAGKTEAGAQTPEPQTERFYTILLSFVPGLGHFQLGLMQRGLTFLMMFFGALTLIVFITFVTRQDGFLVFLGVLPVIWLYNLFDAIRLLQQKQQGMTLHDATLLEDWEKHRDIGRKSTLVATLLALVPGAGHMYLGLQKRGLQLMASFLFSIYILDVLHLSLFLFIIPLLWFFSFFDVLQLISRYTKGERNLEDKPIIDWLVHHQKWIGIAFIALGGFYLLDRVFIQLLQQLLPEIRVAYWFKEYFQTALVSMLLIGGGIKLLLGSRKGGKKS